MQASYKLFATSLLIIYQAEGDSNQLIKSPDQLIDVRWVDFAHAYILCMRRNMIMSLRTLN